jgi:hypothetical protein
MKLNLRVFFFNAKTDYLPYYKNFKIVINDDEPIANVLPKIKEQNVFFNYPEENLYFRVNSLVTDGKAKVSEVVDRLGKELTIEPISKYRVTNCLEINDNNFEEGYKILEQYCDESDRAYYNSLYGVNYASATYEYNNQYIGDGVLLLAAHLIYNKNPNKDAILNAISCDNGLWDAEYEDNMLIKQDYSGTFNLLKDLSLPPADRNKVAEFSTKVYKDRDLSECEEVGVAFYYGSRDNKEIYELSEEITTKGYKEIKFNHSHKTCGKALIATNEELALKKAARVLADAYDSGAGILVSSKENIDYFKRNIGKIEKVANRDILINLADIENFSV